MKLKKIFAAVFAAALCMGTLSSAAFAGGNNMLLPPCSSDDTEEPQNNNENNSTSVSEDESSGAVSDIPEESKPTSTSEESEPTSTPKESEPTSIPEESEPTSAPEESKPTSTPEESKPTATPEESKPTATPVESEPTSAPEESEPTSTPEESEPTSTLEESKPTATPVESEPTSTPEESKPSAVPVDTASNVESNAPVEAKAELEVKLGETVTVKSDKLGGDATVAVAEDETALEGAKLELEVYDKAEDTEKNLNKVMGDSTEDIKRSVKAAVKAVEDGDAVTLDISFVKDGADIQPNNDVTVTSPVPANLIGAEKLFVYHVTDKGLEDVTSKCAYNKEKGTIALTNNTFSPYIISRVEIKAAAAPSEPSDNSAVSPAPADNPQTGAVLAIAPILLAGAALAVIPIKKRR